jgi:hypothetical protein
MLSQLFGHIKNLFGCALIMSEGDSSSWPDDEDPFSAIDEESEEVSDSSDAKEIVSDNEVEEVTQVETMENASWSLPIRSAPIMAQTGDIVQEFSLNESPDGLSSTSVVINDEVIRIVEANYGKDGQRRLNVKTVMRQELTGFSHTHNELMHKHQWLWVAAFVIGLGFSFVAQLSLFGQLLLAIGIIGWIYMHLEVHNLEFSTHGSKHNVTLTGYGSNRPMFRASMALIGPTMAKYIESGDFDTTSIEDLHASLAKPPEAVPVVTPMAPIQTNQMIPAATNETLVVEQNNPALPPPAPPVEMESPQNATEDLPAPPEPNQLPPPAPPESNQLPPPAPPEPVQQNGPPASNAVPPPPLSAPMNNILPPATLPPPLPPPGGALPPPIGFGLAPIDAGEVPLDAPLPNAPQIAVKASPIEESLSPDEQNELLEELK